MIVEQPAVHVDILQSTANVSLKVTYEFSTLAINELVEVINYETSLVALGNFSVTTLPQLTILESKGKHTYLYNYVYTYIHMYFLKHV